MALFPVKPTQNTKQCRISAEKLDLLWAMKEQSFYCSIFDGWVEIDGAYVIENGRILLELRTEEEVDLLWWDFEFNQSSEFSEQLLSELTAPMILPRKQRVVNE